MLRYLAPLIVTFVGLQRLGFTLWGFKLRAREEMNLGESLFQLRVGLLESTSILLLGTYLFFLTGHEGDNFPALAYVAVMFALIAAAWRLGHWLSVRFKPRVDTALVEAARAATEVLQTLAQRPNVRHELKEGSDIHAVLNKLGRALAKYK